MLRLADPESHAAGVHEPAVLDKAVLDKKPAGGVLLVDAAHADAARAGVVHMAALYPAIHAAVAEPDGVVARVAQDALLEGDVRKPIAAHHRPGVEGSLLRIVLHGPWRVPCHAAEGLAEIALEHRAALARHVAALEDKSSEHDALGAVHLHEMRAPGARDLQA